MKDSSCEFPGICFSYSDDNSHMLVQSVLSRVCDVQARKKDRDVSDHYVRIPQFSDPKEKLGVEEESVRDEAHNWCWGLREIVRLKTTVGMSLLQNRAERSRAEQCRARNLRSLCGLWETSATAGAHAQC